MKALSLAGNRDVLGWVDLAVKDDDPTAKNAEL
jgi:hypothetical protein